MECVKDAWGGVRRSFFLHFFFMRCGCVRAPIMRAQHGALACYIPRMPYDMPPVCRAPRVRVALQKKNGATLTAEGACVGRKRARGWGVRGQKNEREKKHATNTLSLFLLSFTSRVLKIWARTPRRPPRRACSRPAPRARRGRGSSGLRPPRLASPPCAPWGSGEGAWWSRGEGEGEEW